MVLLLASCSKKVETAQQTPDDKAEAPAPRPAEKPAEAKSADDDTSVPAMRPPDPPPAVNVDCKALLTSDDVATACGGAKVAVTESDPVAKHAATACALKLTEPGKQFPVARLHLLAFANQGAADGWIRLDKTDDATELTGVGDLAWTRVVERPQLEATEYDVGVRKGNAVLKLGMTKNRLVKKPPCTSEQLAALAKLVAPRLP